jgi:addiction module HigA family antidote
MKMKRKPTHPGVAFKELVIDAEGRSIAFVARAMGYTRVHLSNVVNGKAAVSVGMARSMAAYTKTSFSSWRNMQANIDAWEYENAKN